MDLQLLGYGSLKSLDFESYFFMHGNRFIALELLIFFTFGDGPDS